MPVGCGRSDNQFFISVLADVLSYEFWAFASFILLTVLYVSLFISVQLQCKVCGAHL